jgi:hypothetical protein
VLKRSELSEGQITVGEMINLLAEDGRVPTFEKPIRIPSGMYGLDWVYYASGCQPLLREALPRWKPIGGDYRRAVADG